MNKKFFFGIVTVSACLLSMANLCAAEIKYPPLTAQEQERFDQQVQEQIDASEQKVQKLLTDYGSGDRLLSTLDRMEVSEARTMMNVKKTLASNFAGTISLRSPAVRQKLLELLKKDSISTSDLYDLQTLTAQEKAKIEQEMNQPANTPAKP